MSINKKHLATFILGAAAGVALHKYSQSDDGKELANNLKTKGNELREDAEATINKAPEYFESLKNEASASISELLAKVKNQFPEVENIIADLFSKKTIEEQVVEDQKSKPDEDNTTT